MSKWSLIRSCLSRRSLQRAVGVTVGSLEATFGPFLFFFPIRVGGGGSHFGFCFYKYDESLLSKEAYVFALLVLVFVAIRRATHTRRQSRL